MCLPTPFSSGPKKGLGRSSEGGCPFRDPRSSQERLSRPSSSSYSSCSTSSFAFKLLAAADRKQDVRQFDEKTGQRKRGTNFSGSFIEVDEYLRTRRICTACAVPDERIETVNCIDHIASTSFKHGSNIIFLLQTFLIGSWNPFCAFVCQVHAQRITEP